MNDNKISKKIKNPVLRDIISEIQEERKGRTSFPYWGNWVDWGNWFNWFNWFNWGNWFNWWN